MSCCEGPRVDVIMTFVLVLFLLTERLERRLLRWRYR